jgi:hypothetical protein
MISGRSRCRAKALLLVPAPQLVVVRDVAVVDGCQVRYAGARRAAVGEIHPALRRQPRGRGYIADELAHAKIPVRLGAPDLLHDLEPPARLTTSTSGAAPSTRRPRAPRIRLGDFEPERIAAADARVPEPAGSPRSPASAVASVVAELDTDDGPSASGPQARSAESVRGGRASGIASYVAPTAPAAGIEESHDAAHGPFSPSR